MKLQGTVINIASGEKAKNIELFVETNTRMEGKRPAILPARLEIEKGVVLEAEIRSIAEFAEIILQPGASLKIFHREEDGSITFLEEAGYDLSASSETSICYAPRTYFERLASTFPAEERVMKISPFVVIDGCYSFGGEKELSNELMGEVYKEIAGSSDAIEFIL